LRMPPMADSAFGVFWYRAVEDAVIGMFWIGENVIGGEKHN